MWEVYPRSRCVLSDRWTSESRQMGRMMRSPPVGVERVESRGIELGATLGGELRLASYFVIEIHRCRFSLAYVPDADSISTRSG